MTWVTENASQGRPQQRNGLSGTGPGDDYGHVGSFGLLVRLGIVVLLNVATRDA